MVQKIAFVDQEDLPTTPADAPILPAAPEDIKIYNKLGRATISTEKPGSILYKDHRLIVFVFRHERDAARGPDSRAFRGAEVYPDADDDRGSDFHHQVFGRRSVRYCRISRTIATGC